MNQLIRQKLNNIDNLPSLPLLVTQLIQMIDDPDVSADDINKLASNDIALTTKILKLVNSAYYGFSRKISTLTQGIIILGFKTVKNLSLSTSVLDIFKNVQFNHFQSKDFWLHSIAVGTTAQIIGNEINYPNKEELFIAGLMHDLGKLIMVKYFEKDFNNVMIYLNDNSEKSFYEAEQELLDYNHTQLGGWVAEKWNFPKVLISAVAEHHNLENFENEKISGIIHISDIFIKLKRIGFSGDYVIPNFNQEIWSELNITKETTLRIFSEIDKNLKKINELLSISQT